MPSAPSLVTALLVYALVATLFAHRWVSGIAAPLVAVVMWRRHRRARFSAYVFFSAVALRATAVGSWGAFLFALAAVGLMQTPAAARAWPRLRPGRGA